MGQGDHGKQPTLSSPQSELARRISLIFGWQNLRFELIHSFLRLLSYLIFSKLILQPGTIDVHHFKRHALEFYHLVPMQPFPLLPIQYQFHAKLVRISNSWTIDHICTF